MKILLTGGAGYIGSHAAVALNKEGHQVVLFDNYSNSTPGILSRLARITGQFMTCIEGDVRDADLLLDTLQSYSIEAVVHFAGLKAVGESVKQPVDYYSNNVQGTISLLEAMGEANCRTLVFSSSATVYGKSIYLPYDEEHPTQPENPYGRCKLHVEEMLADLAMSDSLWRIASLRYFNPVGAHESGLIGDKPNGIPNNLMPYIAQVATGQRDALSIFGNDYLTRDGTGVRDYIHVMDLAEGHVAALKHLNGHTGRHVFNLGSGIGYSVLEMVKSFEAVSGKNIPKKIMPRRLGDIAEFYANPAKANQQLNWHASRTLEDMCSSSWQFQKNCFQDAT